MEQILGFGLVFLYSILLLVYQIHSTALVLVYNTWFLPLVNPAFPFFAIKTLSSIQLNLSIQMNLGHWKSVFYYIASLTCSISRLSTHKSLLTSFTSLASLRLKLPGRNVDPSQSQSNFFQMGSSVRVPHFQSSLSPTNFSWTWPNCNLQSINCISILTYFAH